MYIINDYLDFEKDLLNNSKKKRPIASGKISKNNALFFFLLLQFFLFFILLISNNIKLLYLLLIYNIAVLAYTIKFKRIKYVDVFFLGFFSFIEFLLEQNIMV